MNLFLSVFFLIISSNSFSKTEVKTEQNVDLNRYIGKWYEIASIPQFFQRDCIGNSSAVYTLSSNNIIKVVNSCDTEEGKEIAEGRAKVVDKKTNSKLEVTFVNFFGWLFLLAGDYWILEVDENYSYALVGDPSTKYAWILSREESMSLDKLKAAEKVFLENGYDSCKILTSIQDNGFKERKPLCEVLSGP